MTDANRLNEIQRLFAEILSAINTPSSLDEEKKARENLQELNPTTQELLKIAFRESKLPESFDVSTVLETPDEDNAWEETERTQRELDELCAAAEEEEDYSCHSCGTQCVSYEVDGETHWLCESCYYGHEEPYAYGETGLDWNDSGYFD